MTYKLFRFILITFVFLFTFMNLLYAQTTVNVRGGTVRVGGRSFGQGLYYSDVTGTYIPATGPVRGHSGSGSPGGSGSLSDEDGGDDWDINIGFGDDDMDGDDGSAVDGNGGTSQQVQDQICVASLWLEMKPLSVVYGRTVTMSGITHNEQELSGITFKSISWYYSDGQGEYKISDILPSGSYPGYLASGGQIPDFTYTTTFAHSVYLFLKMSYECHGNQVEMLSNEIKYDPPSPKYYITVPGDPKKYFEGSEIPVLSDINKINLKINDLRGSVSTDYKWWRNGTATSCPIADNCDYARDVPGTYTVRVTGPSGNVLLQIIKLKINNAPLIVKFHHKYYNTTNNQNYGFDEEAPVLSVKSDVKSLYENITVGGQPYNVPWMSLTPLQDETVQIEIQKNSNFTITSSQSLTFSSPNPAILINGVNSYPVNGANINMLQTITVTLPEMNTPLNNFGEGFIEVKNELGDIVGKLNVSCQLPQIRKLVVVYVNTGSGYRSDLNKTTLQDYLNSYNGFGPIFKNFQLQDVSLFPDQLDITSEFSYPYGHSNYESSLRNDFLVVARLNELYEQKYPSKGPNAVNTNTTGSPLPGKDRTYFLYVTKIPTTTGSSGIGTEIGHPSACIFGDEVFYHYQTSLHELAHDLNITHTFQDAIGSSIWRSFVPTTADIPEGSTRNFMDYSDKSLRDRFFYYQKVNSY